MGVGEGHLRSWCTTSVPNRHFISNQIFFPLISFPLSCALSLHHPPHSLSLLTLCYTLWLYTYSFHQYFFLIEWITCLICTTIQIFTVLFSTRGTIIFHIHRSVRKFNWSLFLSRSFSHHSLNPFLQQNFLNKNINTIILYNHGKPYQH